MTNHPDKPLEDFTYHGRRVLIRKSGDSFAFAIEARGGYESMEGLATVAAAKRAARLYHLIGLRKVSNG